MLLPTPVVISTYSDSTADAFGVPARTFTDQPATKARLAQQDSTEATDGIQQTVSDWLCILPAGTQIGARDRVKALGLTFEVVDEPYHAVGRLTEHHVEARLRVVR